MRTNETLAALLRPDVPTDAQLEWAVFLAASRDRDLLVLQRVEGREDRVEEVSLDVAQGEDVPAIARELKQVLDRRREAGGEVSATGVRLLRVHFTNLSSLRRLLLKLLREHRVRTFTATFQRPDDGVERDLVHGRRLFLRYIPCETVIFQGLERWRVPSRILAVATSDHHGRAAMRLARDLTGEADGTLTALQVNPPVGPLASDVGDRRLERSLRRSLGPGASEVKRQVVVDDQPEQGIRRAWDDGDHDLVVLGARQVPVDRGGGIRLGKGVPVVTVTDASPLAGRFREILEDTVSRIVPQIERNDRIALVDRLQSSAAWNFDFIALMVLSTIIAAVGLIQNSAAVVIGAMLVAPLMTPLLALGLSIEQGNPALARLSLRSVGEGVGVALVCGFGVGVATAGFEEPSREMLARGGPGFLDLIVAFVAGLAAAYATCRPNLVAALPGVAIAAALVPPIATSGLAFALGDVRLAFGALLLFGINMVTIVLAAMTSLWAVGIRPLAQRARWLQAVGIGIIVAALGLGVYLSLHKGEAELTQEVPPGLVAAIEEQLGTAYSFDSLAVAYDELGIQLNVHVVGDSPASEDLAAEVRSLASDYYDQPVRVRLLTRITTEIETGAAAEEDAP